MPFTWVGKPEDAQTTCATRRRPTSMLVVFLTYLSMISLLFLFEGTRVKYSGADLFTCFNILLVIQTLVPAAVVTGAIALGFELVDLNRPFFQRVFDDLDSGTAMHVLLLTAMFLLILHLSYYLMARFLLSTKQKKSKVSWVVSMDMWLAIVAIGLFSNFMLLQLLGGGVDGYISLIQLRAGSDTIIRSFLTANLYSLTQAFSIISVVGIVYFLRKKSTVGLLFAIVLMLFFALMTVSRRAIFIDVLLVYFVLVIESGNFYVWKRLVPITMVALPVVMFGKQFLASIAFNSDVDVSEVGVGEIVRAFMDIGITNVESWATLMYMHEPFRFGVDHLLSVARRVPDGLLSMNIQFPERIVRHSTEVFSGPGEADIPPGLFGQMWLDWGYFGPVIWGVLFGMQLGILQHIFGSITRSWGVTTAFVILLFVIALPLNSGSFDFTFSIDIFVLIFFLALIVRVSPARSAEPRSQVASVDNRL